jgi:hypothetical protein
MNTPESTTENPAFWVGAVRRSFYRCGYCGQPTDKDGEPLDLEACKTWQEDKAELVHGNCCVHEQNQRQTIIVTRDMAIDAGDMSLDGQEWVW